jgi:hypothetical protein
VTGFGIALGITPGGIFTRATNIGRQTRNEFTGVPEAQLRHAASLPRSMFSPAMTITDAST